MRNAEFSAVRTTLKTTGLALLALLAAGCGSPQGTQKDFVGGVPTGSLSPLGPGGNGSTGTTCFKVTDPIPFTGTGVYLDFNDIMAGSYPGGEKHGTVTMGGNNGPFSMQGQSPDGLIQMGFQTLANGSVNAVGRLQLSNEAQADARAVSPNQEPCVTGLGINLGYTSSYTIYDGYIYMYLNGTSSGIILFF